MRSIAAPLKNIYFTELVPIFNPNLTLYPMQNLKSIDVRKILRKNEKKMH